MKRVLVLLLLSFSGTAVNAVPVVPNFQQGSMTSHTETESTITDTIYSVDMRTGWEYTVSGVGFSADGEALNPNVNTSTVTTTPQVGSGEGALTGTVTSQYDNLDFNTQGTFTITTPGEAFQFVQSYQGPGMTNQTLIQRVTTIRSVTDTTSTFTQ